MQLFPDRKKSHRPITRFIAAAILPGLLYILTPTELIPQTYQSFENAKLKVDRYFDRASRMNDRDAWENYVDLGIAHERVEWEQEAVDVFWERVNEIRRADVDQETKDAELAAEEAQYEAAAAAWDAEANAARDLELGRFVADREAVSVAERGADEYEAIIAATEAAMAGDPMATLSDWDAAMSTDHAALVAAFETELASEMTAARTAGDSLDADVRQAFNDQLDVIEADLRAEFQARDRFYITRARNRYVAVLRGDDLNARLAAEEGSADAVVDELIAATTEKLASETRDQLDAAITEAESLVSPAGVADFDAAGTNWEARMEAVIDAGLRSWQTAEEDLYAKRLAWQEKSEAERESANAIWEEQYDKLVGARNEWLDEIQVQIQAGRDEWQAKIAEFREGRRQAEDELADYIQSERERWDAASGELASIVSGGGAALLETKDAYRYYDELITAMGPPGTLDPRDVEVYQFYVDQRDYMAGAVGRFQGILAGAEGVLEAQMHSPESSSGLLNDVRLVAGDLPETVAAIGAGNFEADLTAEMSARGEDFLLYRRDIEGIIERNAIFVERAGELQASSDFDYMSAADLTAMGDLIGAVDRKYDEHRIELAEIFNEDRTDLADDAARLDAIQTDITNWFAESTDRDGRLKSETVEYFNVGLGGYYLTGNQGDPYLMSQAEYEWELLRRERNYLTKKLRRAEEVKRYADLAFQHEAGLEMAAVTAERADIAKVRRDLYEISYLIIKGDPALDLDPAVVTDPAVRDSELTRLLNERGIDTTSLDGRETTIATETARLDDILAYGTSAPTAAELNARIADLDAYLEATYPDSDPDFATLRGEHPLGLTRAKLLELRDQIAGGSASSEVADRWTTLRGGVEALRGELQALADAYNFNGLRADIETLRDRMEYENLTTIRGDLDQIKQQIEANATLLADAASELDLAKEAYRQARIDFDVIKAGNSDDLIRIDLLNTTSLLSSVTHRMAAIEDIDGWNGTYTRADEQRVRYLNEISQRERAVADLTDSRVAFEIVQGLEAARERNRQVQALVGANGGGAGLAGLSAKDLADLWISAKALVLAEGASDAGLNSSTSAADAFGILEFARVELDRLETELADAITGGEADEIAVARARLAEMQDAVYRSVETFIAATDGEEQARLDALLYYLEDPTADPEALEDRVRADDETLREEAYALSESAAIRLNDFIATNAPNGGGYRSFAELLELVNTEIAGLARGVNVDDGFGAEDGLDDRTRSEWNIVRGWLLANQSAIEYANEAPDEFDPTSIEDKWDALLKVADGIADDADAYSEYATSVPADANDAWVVAFVNERESLKSALETVLATSDAGLAAAYAGLSAAERELAYRYTGPVDPTRAGDLRRALEHAVRAAGLDAAAAPENYEAYYGREKGREYSERMGEIETELADEGARLAALKAEQNEHEQYKQYLEDDGDPAHATRIAELTARIAEIETRITALDPGVTALEVEYRQLAALAREASIEGSSVPLMSEALGELYLSRTGYNQRALSLVLMAGERTLRAEDEDAGPMDAVKAALGFYETDALGAIRRDGSGTPIVAQEFIDAGIADPAADLSALLAGNQRGDDLLRWAERLNATAADQTRAAKLEPEVLAAIDGLEQAIRGYLTATELINRRYETAETIKTDATAAKATSEGRLDKLGQILTLENELRAAIDGAVQSGGDPVSAALSVLESEEAARKLRLFEGYDSTGARDDITDTAAAEKTAELKRMASRLRRARLDRRVLEVAAQYAAMQTDYATLVTVDRSTLPPDRQALLDALNEFDAQPTIDAVNTITVDPDPANAAQTRTDLWTLLGTLPDDARYYRGVIVEKLTDSTNEGAALKSEIITALTALQTEINDRLAVHMDESERVGAREGELQVTNSVTSLITAYATRATTAQTAIQPAIDAIPELTDITTARNQIRADLDTLTDEDAADDIQSALHTIRRELIAIINDAPDTLTLKTEITTYLTNLNDPSAAELTQLEDELYVTSLQNAIATLNLSTKYEEEDYPTELRALILTREYQTAEEVYAEYQRQRNSTNTEESENASLILTGIHEPIATAIMVRDFEAWLTTAQATTTLINDRRATGEHVTLSDYMAGYYEDRGTAPGYLPGASGELAERVMKVEYARLQNDITTNGIEAVDEDDYFDDLREYIQIQKAVHYYAANGTTLTGATVTERRTNYETDFNAFINDATYTLGGETISQRTIGKHERDRLFAVAFAWLEESPPLDAYLPPSLTYAAGQGTIDDPLKTETEYLPDDLTAVTGYATADYRAMAAAISTQTEAALARIEVAAEAGLNDLTITRTDAELNTIIDEAGYTTLPAPARTEILTMLRAQNTFAEAGGASTPEQAAQVLRQNRVLTQIYATETEQATAERFLAAEAERLSSIEEKFFEALADRHSDLREAAKESRGEFLRALIEHERGTDTAYYTALTPELQAEMNLLHAELYGTKLNTEEREALRDKSQAYEDMFDLRSGQELVASGLFESTEATIITAVQRSQSETTRALLNDHGNRTLLTRALIETVHVNAGQRGVSTEAQTLLSTHPDLATIVTRTADEMAGGQRDLIQREQVLIDRFYTHFTETAEERRTIGAILNDPAVLQPDAALGADYDIQRELNLLARNEVELTAALTGAVSDHQRFYTNLAQEYEREAARANDLLKFAVFRGDDYQTSRFSNYRTYIGSERNYQLTDFTNIENNGGTLEGASLAITDIETTLMGDWQALLTSDDTGTFKTVTDDNGDTIEIRAVKTVTDAATRYTGNDAAAQQAEMRATYFENLANNYLEATSQLNSALNAIWTGAQMAETRKAEARTDIKQTVRDNYDENATAAQDLTAIEDLKIDAQSRLSTHSATAINDHARGIAEALEQQAEQSETFAGAGRRKQIAGMNLTAYLENRFTAVATAMATAEDNHTTLSTNADTLRDDFAARNRDHADALERMAEYWREYEAANDAYEERSYVQEYAETPYLFASKADSSDQESGIIAEYRGDAKEEYERALAAVDNVQNRLRQKGYEVQTQDNLEEFNAIVTALDAGTTFAPLSLDDADRLLELRDKKYTDYETLTTAEEDELIQLTQREAYNRYEDVIEAQKEHIKQTMRMTRLHKANEIVNAEIMRLRAVSAEKQKQFEQELSQNFRSPGGGHASYANDPGSSANLQTAARDGVYMRLQNLVENNRSFWDEFRGWYWKSNDWAGNAGSEYVSSTTSTPGGLIPQYTMNQILEGAQGAAHANNINQRDRDLIGGWLKAGGQISEFANFQGTYYAALAAIGHRDRMYLKNEIVKGIYIPIRAAGERLNAAAGPFLRGIGDPFINAANANLQPAELEYQISEVIRWSLYQKAHNTAGKGSTLAVMAKQKEYEDSLAKLYYFTRIPDLATFKDRLIQYGAQNSDDPNDASGAVLYQILEDVSENNQTVDDLIYMRGLEGYVKADGTTYTPDAQTISDTLDVSGQLEEADYRDGFGRRYDPATIRDNPGGPLEGGKYRAGDGDYTRIQIAHPNGTTEYKYARLVAETEPKESVYDMGAVLELLVDHGQNIRNREHANYVNEHETAAAVTGDRTFILNERDQTYKWLYDQAAGHDMGGREFTGYRMTYADYNANSAEVFEAELAQRHATQQTEWALREQELIDRYNDWEARVATILERGRKSWAGTEDRFLAEWRKWNKDYDKQMEEGRKAWDDRINEHFTKKKKWEDDTRLAASEATIDQVLSDAVTEMNAQIQQSAQKLGVDIDTLDLTKTLNDAKEELANTMPSGAERLKAINKNIKNFKAQLSIATMTGSDFLSGALDAGKAFREEMTEHQKAMKIQTNVKIFEQYRTMSRAFEDSIDDQNYAVQQMTENSAIQAGFVKQGSKFVKQGSNDARGVADAYKWFDVRGALKREKEAMGFSELTGNDLTNFLETRNEVEVEAFFYSQKLALQAAIERIQGKPGAIGEDPNEIGLFNAWKGAAPNSTLQTAINTAGARAATSGDLNASGEQINQAATIISSGFGELGSFGKRPGGAPLGFYNQLQFAAEFIAKEENNAIKMSPLEASMQSLNFLKMYEDVEVGSKVYRKDRGKLEMGVYASAQKGALMAGGAAIAATGNPLLGGAMMMAASTINVNQTTGETIVKLDDKAVVAGLAGMLGPFSGLISAGAEVDHHGNLKGFDLNGKMERVTLDSATGYLGANAYMQAWTARQLGQTNTYDEINAASQTNGFGVASNFGGIVAGAAADAKFGKGPGGMEKTTFGMALMQRAAGMIGAPVMFGVNLGMQAYSLGAMAYKGLTTDSSENKNDTTSDNANKTDREQRAKDIGNGSAYNDQRKRESDYHEARAQQALREIAANRAAAARNAQRERFNQKANSYIAKRKDDWIKAGYSGPQAQRKANQLRAAFFEGGTGDRSDARYVQGELSRMNKAMAPYEPKMNQAQLNKYATEMAQIEAGLQPTTPYVEPSATAQWFNKNVVQNETVQRVLSVLRNHGTGGDHRFIRDDLIGRGIGAFDAAFNTNLSKRATGLYNKTPGMSGFDRRITPGAHNVMDFTLKSAATVMSTASDAYDATVNWANQVDWGRVGMAALKTGLGAFETAIGAGTAALAGWTGVGAVGGGAIAIHGAAVTATGVAELYNALTLNEYRVQSPLQEAYKFFTGNSKAPSSLGYIDAGLSVLGTGGAGLIQNGIRGVAGMLRAGSGLSLRGSLAAVANGVARAPRVGLDFLKSSPALVGAGLKAAPSAIGRFPGQMLNTIKAIPGAVARLPRQIAQSNLNVFEGTRSFIGNAIGRITGNSSHVTSDIARIARVTGQRIHINTVDDITYSLDGTGRTVQQRARISGSHPGRGKGYRPEPLGGRASGHHRGHQIPEQGVVNPRHVNVRANIISEAEASNLGPKKVIENFAIRLADSNPGGRVDWISQALWRGNETVPYANTHWILLNGRIAKGVTILNQ